MLKELNNIREALFDAPSDTKAAFNTIAKYLSGDFMVFIKVLNDRSASSIKTFIPSATLKINEWTYLGRMTSEEVSDNVINPLLQSPTLANVDYELKVLDDEAAKDFVDRNKLGTTVFNSVGSHEVYEDEKNGKKTYRIVPTGFNIYLGSKLVYRGSRKECEDFIKDK